MTWAVDSGRDKGPPTDRWSIFRPRGLEGYGAFDAAWAEISNNFGDDQTDVVKPRPRLANALLSIASEDSREVEVSEASRTGENGAGLQASQARGGVARARVSLRVQFRQWPVHVSPKTG